MKKIRKIIAFVLLAVMVFSVMPAVVYAQNPAHSRVRPSDIGFFGGITEGARLPLTTEALLAQGARQNGRAQPQEFITYKEQIWITGGAPVEFVGTMTRRQNGQITNAQSGRFTVTYEVRPSAATAPGVYIDRTITYTIDWRREGNQIIENIRLVGANAWRENITIGDTVFTIDPRQSHKSISLIRDEHPGVTYFSGDMAKRAVFTSNGATIVHEVSGRIYGYNSAWSATETHILTGIVSTPAWQLHYQQTPSVTVNSVLQFVPTEPTAISFAGNYREVLQNRSGMTWSINVLPNAFYGAQTSGSSYISSFNTFEQLPAPDVEFLHGHWAQPDIRRLFSMQVLSGEPRHFRPEQGVTRAQFVTMLVRAARMPLVQPTQAQLRNARNGNVTGLVFPDVPPDRPDFPYIMSAYEAGLIRGRGQGRFYTDFIMSREEAYVLTLRILGLTNLGPDPTPMTPFVDDSYIGDWARRDIYAAARIGLIFPDQNGRIHPQQMMTNAEAAALVNRLINYMRHDLARDYTENIINFN